MSMTHNPGQISMTCPHTPWSMLSLKANEGCVLKGKGVREIHPENISQAQKCPNNFVQDCYLGQNNLGNVCAPIGIARGGGGMAPQ